jgi:transcription initiation factor TFIID TATA-box-binding protein
MVEVVNIVAGGDLGAELDLSELHSHFTSIEEYQASYNTESSNALQLRFEENGPLCMIYRTGKFVITGAGSDESLNETFNRLLKEFRKIDLIGDDIGLEIYNKVFTEDLGNDIDLSKLSIYLGFENTEYEPEQTPFLVYNPSDTIGVVTIASSGKIVVNGIRTKKEAEDIAKEIGNKVSQFLSQ